MLLRVLCANRRVEVLLPSDGIEGEVRAARDGAALAGARAAVIPAEGRGVGAAAVADAGGRFRFPSLPPGDYGIEVSLRGFGTARVGGVRVLRGGGATPVRILLEAAGRVRGTVRDATGRPVPGAVVEATDARSGDLLPGGRRSADAAGTYALDGLVPGTFALTARAGGLGASPPEVVALGPGEEREVDLALLPGGTLEVRVVGPGGGAIEDASVEVRDFLGVRVPSPEGAAGGDDPLHREGRTGADGLLRVPGLRAGVYVVRAWKGDLAEEVRVRVDVRGGTRTVVALIPPKEAR